LRLLQGRHFQRPGWICVSADIAKGRTERWVPVLPDLEPIVARITREVGPHEYVFPFEHANQAARRTDRTRPANEKVIWRAVKRIARRAGLSERLTVHTMRHGFADWMSRMAGLRTTQALMGHASLQTTEGYLGAPTLDELAEAVSGLHFLPPEATPAVAASGDGGNRTHVRGRVRDGFYERSRLSGSRLPLAVPTGLREASPLGVPTALRASAVGEPVI
jgi:Phage integrase family